MKISPLTRATCKRQARLRKTNLGLTSSTLRMDSTRSLRTRLSDFSVMLQDELFPRLEATAGPLTAKLELFVACCATIPFRSLLPAAGKWNGRPAKDRLAIARAFLAKSVFGLSHTRQLLEVLQRDQVLRGLCGWKTAREMPHESTFSRAFAEFAAAGLVQAAHEAVIASTQAHRLVGHICRDATAILARERYPEPAAPPKRRTKKKTGGRKKHQAHAFRRETQEQRLAVATRLEKQAATQDVAAMLADVPTACDLGGKRASHGNTNYWRGYKLHLDVADGQIPITALLTSASVHDSQVAIPLMHITSKRVTYLYDLADSAYDAAAIRRTSIRLGHKPIIDFHTRPAPVTQLPCRVKPQPQMSPAEHQRYRERTLVERVFARLKDEFGASSIRVRGPAKVMTHLMFSVLALTIDQTLRLAK